MIGDMMLETTGSSNLPPSPACKCGATCGLFIDGDKGWRCVTCLMAERDHLRELLRKLKPHVPVGCGNVTCQAYLCVIYRDLRDAIKAEGIE